MHEKILVTLGLGAQDLEKLREHTGFPLSTVCIPYENSETALLMVPVSSTYFPLAGS